MAILVSILLLTMPLQTTAQQQFVEVINRSVNVRERPTVASKLVQKVYAGDVFALLGKQGDWCRIRLSPNKTAWIASHWKDDIYLRIFVRDIPPPKPLPSPVDRHSDSLSLITLLAIGLVAFCVFCLVVFLLWRRVRTGNFANSEDYQFLRKSFRNRRFPNTADDTILTNTLVKQTAIIAGGGGKDDSEWETISHLVAGLLPVLADLNSFLIHDLRRDEHASTKLVFDTGRAILKEFSEEEGDEND